MLVSSTILPPRITSNTVLPSRDIERSNENNFITTSATTLIINDASTATSNTSVTESNDLRIPEIHDELDAKINALEERFNDLRDELGAKINVLEERFANILGASFDDLRDEPSYTIRDLYDRLNALEQRSSALEQRSNALEQRVNDTQNSFTTNSLTVNEINVNRWKISYESNVALVCRDMQGNGDKRYAMWNNKHVNL
ncbi:4853_t:CDS:2 [Gigaspora rosea]|nr:4853_t:CDS:2 [Gigaspora rosea]